MKGLPEEEWGAGSLSPGPSRELPRAPELAGFAGLCLLQPPYHSCNMCSVISRLISVCFSESPEDRKESQPEIQKPVLTKAVSGWKGPGWAGESVLLFMYAHRGSAAQARDWGLQRAQEHRC